MYSMYDGRKVTVNGRTFDVPSWISDDEFVKGLHSDDAENPLSSLVSLEHINGSDDCKLDDYEISGESYHATFLIPKGCSRWLCYSSDSAFSSPRNSDGIKHEATSDGLLIRLDVSEPWDINNVQAHFYKDDEAGIAALMSGIEDFDDYGDMPADVSEKLGSMKPGEFSDVGWDGYIDRMHTDHGDFIAVVSKFDD